MRPLGLNPQAHAALRRRSEEEEEEELTKGALLRAQVQEQRLQEVVEEARQEAREQLARHVGQMSRELEELRAERRAAGQPL